MKTTKRQDVSQDRRRGARQASGRSGSFFLALAVCGLFGIVVLVAKNASVQMEQEQTLLSDQRIHVGHKALGQTSNMVTIGSIAEEAGGLTVALEWALINAVRTLTTNVELLHGVEVNEDIREDWDRMIRAYDELMSIANYAIEYGYPTSAHPLGALVTAGREARESLEIVLGKILEETSATMQRKSEKLRAQQTTIFLSFIGLTMIAGVCIILLRREILERQALQNAERHIEFLAYHDALTGLPNRSQFQERVDALFARESDLALLHVDLDEFKAVNDTYGHATGDAVLTRVGDVLSSKAEILGGFAARLGGDEFAVVATSNDLLKLETLCKSIIHELAQPFLVEGESLTIGVSIGLATREQIAGKEHAELAMLSRVTDYALYESKANGRSRYTLYNQELEQRFQERRALLDELPRAIENEELEVFLQPKVNLPNHDIYGFEALVRWRRNGILVSPSDFISIAEESGSVLDLDHFVLKRATRHIAAWNKAHGTEFSVSVNLSAMHFNSKRVIDWVETALWHNGLPAQLLTLEITESVEMRDWSQASEVLQGLKEIGALIAIDDFGTGYSSLAYLKAIMAHELKIDRTLVDELESSKKARVLLGSVLDVAHNLGHEVTVEGIETAEQAAIVHELGAGHGQGYFFGRPEPALNALERATAQARSSDDAAAS